MTQLNFHQSSKLTQLNKLSKRLNRKIKDGSFFKLSSQKRQKIFKTIKRLHLQLQKLLPQNLKHKLAASALVLSLFGFSSVQGQNFTPPQVNPFGLTSFNSAFSTPDFADLDSDGDLDMVSGDYRGFFFVFQNIGTSTSPNFAAPQILSVKTSDQYSKPSLVDIDGDGDFDLVTGSLSGDFEYFENIGSATFFDLDTTRQVNPFGLKGYLGNYSYDIKPDFVDIDNDGDLDVFAGTSYIYNSSGGGILYQDNSGSATMPAFGFQQQNPFNIMPASGVYFFAPSLGDLDNDGDMDLITGDNYGNMLYFKNSGSATAPSFDAHVLNPFGLDSVGYYAVPAFVDLDNDGDLDLMVGDDPGNFTYFENTSNNPGIKKQTLNLDLKIYPNPTKEQFTLEILDEKAKPVLSGAEAGNLLIEILDSKGKIIKTQNLEIQPFMRKEFNLSDFSPGIYFIRMQNQSGVLTKRITLIE